MKQRVFTDEPTENEIAELRHRARSVGMLGIFIDSQTYVYFDRGDKPLAPSVGTGAGEAGKVVNAKNCTDRKPDDQKEPNPAGASPAEEAPKEGGSSEQGSESGVEGTLTGGDHETALAAPPAVSVVSVKAVERLLARLESAERKDDAREQLGKRFKAMIARGPLRKLAALSPSWPLLLDELSDRFPNFRAAIEFVRTECIIASMTSQRVVRLPPMMLAGELGVGKTAFAKELGIFLSGGFYSVAMENAQTGAALSGSAQYWSTTRTGKVFDAVIDDEYANPVFLVDELDKATGHQGYDPLAPLYQFLERHQAAVFHDESMPNLSIDASHIIWLLTANDLTKVAAPILSRLQIFDVPAPGAVRKRVMNLAITHNFSC